MSSLDKLLKKEVKTVNNKVVDEQIDDVIKKNNKDPVKIKQGYMDKVKDKVENQRQQIKKEKTKNDGFNDTDRTNMREQFIKKHGLRRKEKKRILMGERTGMFSKQNLLLGVFAVSLLFLVMVYSYSPENDILMSIVFLVGIFLFLPIGMIVGWMTLDSFMRCKMIRKVTRKNYGIVNFVGKGKKIISKIKNFDADLVWIKNKCWALTKGGIYEIDKYGERINEGDVIDPDGVLTITETVPVLFIDMDSVEPLTFQKEGREGIMPEELGATLKGWVDNQMAKVMFLKRTMDAYFMLVIIACFVAAYFAYTNNQMLTELDSTIQGLQSDIDSLRNTINGLISNLPPPS